MSEESMAHALDVAQLQAVDAALHDAAFSMANVQFDDGRGIVEIQFYEASKTRDLSFRSASKPESSRLLRISDVASVSVHDPEELVEHTYAHIESPRPGRLTLWSNFPGQLDFDVGRIDVEVIG
jgi:hypothetical protein